MDQQKNSLVLPILIALSSVGFFGLMFIGMGYFELIGADVGYFDAGSDNNLKIINMVLNPFGFNIDPRADLEITTRGYAMCYGLALIVAFGAMILAGRESRNHLETTDAKK